MKKNILKTTIISLLLFSSILFIGIDNVKACKCYYETDWFEYAASANPDGSNSSSQMKAMAIIEYTANSADVVNSCVGMRTYSQGSNAYQPGKNMLYVESFDKCTLKDFDRGNPFDVDSKQISDANCSVESCEKAKIYYYPGGSGEIQTKSGVFNHKFTAETAEQQEATINEDNQTAAENGKVEDINPSDVVSSEPTIEEIEKGNTTCEIIPTKIVNFLKNLFLVIQVIGIVLLVVMTIIEFIKSITGSDDEGLKKAIKNMFRRIVITVILLILPALIIWVLNIVNSNAYESDETGKHIIGSNGEPICKWK